MTRIATILAALVAVLTLGVGPAEASKRRPHRPVVIHPVIVTLPDFTPPVDGPAICPRAPVAHPVCIPVVR